MGGKLGQGLLLAALVAGVGCGGESLGGHPPPGLMGTGGDSSGSGRGGSPAAGGSGDVGGSGGDAGGGGDVVGNGGDVGTGFGGALGDGGAVGAGGTGPFCGSVETVVAPVPDVLVLLDRSSSMNDDTSGTSCTGGCGPTSKWAVLGAALDQLVHENTSVNWGLAFFGADDQCGVKAGAAVDVGPNSASAIEAMLGTVRPGGEAPTAAAIYAASSYLQSRVGGAGKYILLATDGRSGCGPSNSGSVDTDAANAALSATDEGVTTVVVGAVPASDTAATLALNDIAQIGGAPASGTNAFYTMADFGPQFPPAASAVGSCAVSLPQPAVDRTLVVDRVGSGGALTSVPEDPVNGWSFSAAMDSIVLNGSSCVPGSAIELTYVCSLPPLGHERAQK